MAWRGFAENVTGSARAVPARPSRLPEVVRHEPPALGGRAAITTARLAEAVTRRVNGDRVTPVLVNLPTIEGSRVDGDLRGVGAVGPEVATGESGARIADLGRAVEPSRVASDTPVTVSAASPVKPALPSGAVTEDRTLRTAAIDPPGDTPVNASVRLRDLSLVANRPVLQSGTPGTLPASGAAPVESSVARKALIALAVSLALGLAVYLVRRWRARSRG